MTKRQRVSIWIAVVIIVLGLGSYATYTLMSKMNQVKELNGQIAEADKGDSVNPEAEDSATQPGGGEEKPADVAVVPPADKGDTSSGVDHAAGSVDPSATAAASATSTATAKPQSTDKPAQQGAGEPGSSAGTVTPASTPSPADLEERKQAIDQSVTASMESLRAACKAKSSGLVAQIKAEIAADPDAAVDTLQKEFLGQVIAAEADCDSQFAELVGQAKAQYKAAGIAESGLPDWSAEYDNAKADARSAALTEIASAIQ